VSERERFYIEGHYQDYVTGDLEKTRQVYELWAQTYPRDDVAHYSLSATYRYLGQYDKALTQAGESLRLQPGDCGSYAILVAAYINLNRLDEARVIAEEAKVKKLDCYFLRYFLYNLAFVQNDPARMTQQVEGAVGEPFEDSLLRAEADTAAYSGRLSQARELSAVQLLQPSELCKKEAAWYLLNRRRGGSIRIGRSPPASKAALALSTSRDVQYGAALALVLPGRQVGQKRCPMAWASGFRRIPSFSLLTCRRCARTHLSAPTSEGRRGASGCQRLRIGDTGNNPSIAFTCAASIFGRASRQKLPVSC
jgi:tetratricopeptide (TPR) repeat protein